MALYQLHNDGRIARFTGMISTGWEVLDNNPATTAITAAAGNLYQLLSDGRIARYTGTPITGWEVLDNNPATTAITADGDNLYQLLSDGRIARYTGPYYWRETGNPSDRWELLNDNPPTAAIAADAGNLYLLLTDGRIARYTGTPITGWEVLDNNPATAAIVAAGKALYQLLGDGRIIARQTAAPMSPFDVLGEDPATTAIAATTRALYRLLSDGKIAQYVGPPISGWEVLDDNSSTRMIAVDSSMPMGYPDQPSVIPGGVLQLHVSTEAPTFRVDLFRQGRTLEFKHSSPWYGGLPYPSTYPSVRWDQDWGWPSYGVNIPQDLPSGVYIAMLREGDGRGNILRDVFGDEIVPDEGLNTSHGQWGKVLFVVRKPANLASARILYKLGWTTYHAYNWAGSGSLYRDQDHYGQRSPGPSPSLMNVTMHRPGGGTGAVYEPHPDHNAPLPTYFWSPPIPDDATFEQKDPSFIGWLEENGYEVDYCTDLDIHMDASLELLRSYRLLLSTGHDEYWSPEMRQNVEAYRNSGGNVAFFSGNTCWWRIHFTDPDAAGIPTAFTCDKTLVNDSRFPVNNGWYNIDQWYASKAPDVPSGAENSLTGGSYRNGGGSSYEPRPPLGLTVQHADHWVYDGTGLQNGAVFGELSRLLGDECDGAFFDPNAVDSNGLLFPAATDGTPSNFIILGVGLLSPPQWGLAPRESYNDAVSPVHAATMGIYETAGGGSVFTGATTDWALSLGRMHDPNVEQITRNVLNRLSR
jgi:hypothetical protein